MAWCRLKLQLLVGRYHAASPSDDMLSWSTMKKPRWTDCYTGQTNTHLLDIGIGKVPESLLVYVANLALSILGAKLNA